MPPPLVEFRNASVMRGARLVLDRIGLSIAVDEHVAILGPNGCGKSTLIKTLTRELYPLARPGSCVRIFGREVWNIFELRPLLGIVTNEYPTQGWGVNGRDVVLSGFFSSVGIWPHMQVTPAMIDKAGEVLDLLGITHLAGRDYEELSSGEARRLLIARALVHAPKALVLDEPSNSLDLFAQHELREAMRRLARSGTAIILVTHQLSDIIPEIERVVFMRNGRIARDGHRSELLRPGPIGELFGVPVEVAERNGYVHAW